MEEVIEQYTKRYKTKRSKMFTKMSSENTAQQLNTKNWKWIALFMSEVIIQVCV